MNGPAATERVAQGVAPAGRAEWDPAPGPARLARSAFMN